MSNELARVCYDPAFDPFTRARSGNKMLSLLLNNIRSIIKSGYGLFGSQWIPLDGINDIGADAVQFLMGLLDRVATSTVGQILRSHTVSVTASPQTVDFASFADLLGAEIYAILIEFFGPTDTTVLTDATVSVQLTPDSGTLIEVANGQITRECESNAIGALLPFKARMGPIATPTCKTSPITANVTAVAGQNFFTFADVPTGGTARVRFQLYGNRDMETDEILTNSTSIIGSLLAPHVARGMKAIKELADASMSIVESLPETDDEKKNQLVKS